MSFGRNFVAWDSETTGFTLEPNVWYHLCVARSSGTLKIFINGVSYYSATNNNSYVIQNSIVAIGARQSISGSESYGFALDGYLDDLRVTKGLARYTSNFTLPIRSFPDRYYI